MLTRIKVATVNNSDLINSLKKMHMGNSKVIRASHEGILKLGDAEIEVAVLENGQRIITLSGVFTALDRPKRGNSRVIGIPTFMDAQNLQPFIDNDLKAVIKKVEYENKNGKIIQGFDANILPLVSDLYLRAREAGAITSRAQLATAQKAEILVRSLAKVAIAALIDEATGYQEVREKDALQLFLQKFLNEERGKWVKTFPDEFFESIFRMKGWTWSIANKGKKPQVVGHYINNYVYSRLAPQVLAELRRLNPKEGNNRKGKHTQYIDVDFGHPKLKEHINILNAFAKAVGYNWSNWERMIERALPKFAQDGSAAQELDFEDL